MIAAEEAGLAGNFFAQRSTRNGSALGFILARCPLSVAQTVSMNEINVQIKTLPHFEGLPLPQYQTEGASGIDLLAACQEPVTIQSGDRVLIPTGIIIALPKNLEAQIRPRSGLAIKHGMIWPNLNFTTPMKELKISPEARLIRDIEVRNVLSNSFGFGGNNSTLIFSNL